jgi:hypothetical protein
MDKTVRVWDPTDSGDCLKEILKGTHCFFVTLVRFEPLTARTHRLNWWSCDARVGYL